MANGVEGSPKLHFYTFKNSMGNILTNLYYQCQIATKDLLPTFLGIFPQKNQFLHFFWTGFPKKYKSYLNNKNLFGKKCLLKIWSHT
jgi:hypothetical protein